MRDRLALIALFLAGCSTTTTALEVNVKIDQTVVVNAAKVRLIVSATGGAMFPMTTETTARTDVNVRNFDIDGDGQVDIVIEFSPKYALAASNRFRLTPAHQAKPLPVDLRVDVLDAFENRFARIGGPSASRVAALLTPGQVTVVKDLEPTCIADGCPLTLKNSTTGATSVIFGGKALDAAAAGNLTGAAPRRADVAVGSQHDDSSAAVPNAGLVEVFFGGATLSANPDVTITGAEAGGRLGAALAIGDLDGDGADDLVIGSPGAGDTAGAVYVVYGAATWPSTIDLTASSSILGAIAGLSVGDRLGEGLALADVDGDGHLDVLAAAPGASTVFVVRSADVPRGGKGNLAQVSSLKGPAGVELGRQMAIRGSHLAVAAPLAADTNNAVVGAVYVLDASDIKGANTDAAGFSRLVGAGGGFGGGLGFADVDGSGTPSVVVAAPQDGNGTVSLFTLAGLAAGDTPVSSAKWSLRATAPNDQLGSSLGFLPQPLGDVLLLGAPSSQPAASPGSGMTFAVGGPTLSVLPSLVLDTDGRPAAVAVSGDKSGDAFGSHLLIDDFNQDGLLDMVVGAAGNKTLYLFQGPLQ
jgi:hypothetical protein